MTCSAKQLSCSVCYTHTSIQKNDSKEPENLLTYDLPEKAGLYGLVIIARREPPVPISNTTVKPLSADGTMS